MVWDKAKNLVTFSGKRGGLTKGFLFEYSQKTGQTESSPELNPLTRNKREKKNRTHNTEFEHDEAPENIFNTVLELMLNFCMATINHYKLFKKNYIHTYIHRFASVRFQATNSYFTLNIRVGL